MIKDHLRKVFLTKFKFELTPGQDLAVDKLIHFILSPYEKNKSCFLLKGYAGTGKTSLVSALIQTLNQFEIKLILMAPTGRAAKVFSSFSGLEAFTIHKTIYRQKTSKDGFGEFVLNQNKFSDAVFFCDEASMVSNDSLEKSIFGSGRLLNDLVQFVLSGKDCRLVLLGDNAQLPPVGYAQSPALDPEYLKNFDLLAPFYELTEVVRQASGSGILSNATSVRTLIQQQKADIPVFKTDAWNDFGSVKGEELIESIDKSYSTYGIDQTMIVCRSNKRANNFNKGIREKILFREEEISSGDLLMVVKNNYYWTFAAGMEGFIANGDIVKLIRIKKFEERYGFRFVHASVELTDYENLRLDVILILDAIWAETPALSGDENKKLFYSVLEDYSHLKSRKEQYAHVKEDPYFNAIQVKFAYAVTCHKAQGGQWQHVYVDQGYFTRDMLTIEYLRWLYTALTRASQKIFLVNFSKEFLGK